MTANVSVAHDAQSKQLAVQWAADNAARLYALEYRYDDGWFAPQPRNRDSDSLLNPVDAVFADYSGEDQEWL